MLLFVLLRFTQVVHIAEETRAAFFGMGLFTLMLLSAPVSAQELSPGNYFWYVPEHETTGRTAFYSQPTFSSGMVRVTRAQRFKLLGGRKGWAMIEFDYAGKAYIHLRILRNAMYDPAASDPWYEFKRASVFYEEPAKTEARLRSPASPSVQFNDSKTPAWKRYKEGWSVKPGGRSPQVATEGGENSLPASETSRPALEKKSRNKYPLLPPIGSEPAKEGGKPESAPNQDAPPP